MNIGEISVTLTFVEVKEAKPGEQELALFTSCGLMMLSSCSNEDNTVAPPTDELESQLQRMTLREKVEHQEIRSITMRFLKRRTAASLTK